MVDAQSGPCVSATTLSRRLQAISAGGWANIQAPVREGFEAVQVTTGDLAEQLAASRSDFRRLEERLAGMEETLSQRFERNARSITKEVDALRSSVHGLPGLADVQTIASETCRAWEVTAMERFRTLEGAVTEVRDESRTAVEGVRQASAGKAEISDLQAFYPRAEAASRADLADVDGRVGRKAETDAMEATLATKVSWPDLERLLREKADACAVAELSSSCVTLNAMERVELGLSRAVGMEEVRAFVETQTGNIQTMYPALERLLASRAREEIDVAKRNPGAPVTRAEFPSLIQASLREHMDKDGGKSASNAFASQVQAAISAAREHTIRAVDSQLARARGAQQEELLTQGRRLRMDFEEGVGRLRGVVEGLSKGLEQAKGELVALLNAKAYKADLTLLLQGKADSKELDSATAIMRSKVGDAEYREHSSRTLQALAALSAEIGGVRAEHRGDMDRLSNRLVSKADSEDILAVKRSCSEASAAAAAASASATVASNAWAANTLAIGTNNTQPGQLGHSADSSEVTRRPQASVRGPEVMQKSMAGAKGAGGAVLCMGRTLTPTDAGRGFAGAGGTRITREEARLLIRAELKRAGISEKITREEASVMSEACASNALSIASKSIDAADVRLRAVVDRLNKTTMMPAANTPDILHLLETQSSLELSIARSLSLGRWLWRGGLTGTQKSDIDASSSLRASGAASAATTFVPGVTSLTETTAGTKDRGKYPGGPSHAWGDIYHGSNRVTATSTRPELISGDSSDTTEHDSRGSGNAPKQARRPDDVNRDDDRENFVLGRGAARQEEAANRRGKQRDDPLSEIEGIWVPWEAEAANASPDHLKWTAGGDSVTTAVPGLYVISCGFFCELPFIATVHLNGHPLFSFSSREGGLTRQTRDMDRTYVNTVGSAPTRRKRHYAHDEQLRRLKPGADARETSSVDSVNKDPHHGHDTSAAFALADDAVSASPCRVVEDGAMEYDLSHTNTPSTLRAARTNDGNSVQERGKVEHTHGNIITYPHPEGEVLAWSRREYVAVPAGGIFTVRFGIRTGGQPQQQVPLARDEQGAEVAHKNRMARDSCQPRVGQDLVGKESDRRLCPQAQGFLELHKL